MPAQDATAELVSDRILAIHLGPGQLGLGLVCDVLWRTDAFDICLVGRPGGPTEGKIYSINLVGSGEPVHHREVAWAKNASHLSDLPEEVRGRLASDSFVLVTAALGSAASAASRLLREIFAARDGVGETTFIGCENVPPDEYQQAVRKTRNVHYCASVVDRLCSWPTDAAGAPQPWAASGWRSVLAHPIAEWVIHRPIEAKSPTYDLLDRSPIVRIVGDAKDLAAHKDRKLWCVNGTHQVLALIARHQAHDRDGLPLDPHTAHLFQQRGVPFCDAAIAAARSKHVSLPDDPTYVAQRIKAFGEMPDSVKRIIGTRLVREKLLGLMRAFDERIAAPAASARAAEQPTDAFTGVAEYLIEVLENPLNHYPMDPLAGPADSDRDVVRAFDASIRRWLDGRAARHLVTDLERVLQDTT